MCIIYNKPAGVILPREIHFNSFSGNSDGSGYAYAEDGKLVIRKGFFTFDDFYEDFKQHENKACVVHHRYATHGAKNAENCHPWFIDGEKFQFAVTHNGILAYPSTDEKSDTGHFVDEVLAPMLRQNPWALEVGANVFLLEKFIGNFNKFVILRNDGKIYYLNKQQGVEDKDCWFSNHGYTYRSYRASSAWGYDQEDIISRRMEEWIQKNATRTKQLAEHRANVDAAINVPRDDEDLEDPDVNINDIIMMSPIADLSYLNKRERKRLRRASRIYLEYMGEDLNQFCDQDRIEALRDAYREAHPASAALDEQDLDNEILKAAFWFPASYEVQCAEAELTEQAYHNPVR